MIMRHNDARGRRTGCAITRKSWVSKADPSREVKDNLHGQGLDRDGEVQRRHGYLRDKKTFISAK